MQCVIPSQHIKSNISIFLSVFHYLKFSFPHFIQYLISVLVRGLHSLARIGDDLYVEPIEDRLCFRTVNSSQSAYSSVVFFLPFFNHYKCEFDAEEGVGKCKLSMKVSPILKICRECTKSNATVCIFLQSCLAVFKTPNCMDRNVDSCKIEIDKNFIKLSFQIHFIQGYTKNFFLSVADNETVQVSSVFKFQHTFSIL